MRNSVRTWLTGIAALCTSAALMNACSATGGVAAGGTGAGGSSGALAGPGGSSNGPGPSGTGGDPVISTSATSSSGTIDPDAACTSISSQAQAQLQPADIVIAVDTSGSMDVESGQVQQNLNNFATIITNSGIDVHVVLIADSSVCIPAPLGTGACNGADEKLPAYRHVVQGVGSTDGLQTILATYPQWKGSLRAGATKTIAIVTDDDSAMSAADFTNALLALDPPTFQGFKFDAIASSTAGDACILCALNCLGCLDPCCDKALFCTPLAADEGKVYKQLVQQTMGVFGDLCLQNFGPVFQDMATGIVQSAKLSCEYAIPAVPGGGTIDPTLVNVAYTPGSGGMTQTLFNVPGGLPACGQNGGWYYDDPQNPTKVIMCPSTCTTLQNDSSGKVEVLFGCTTIIAPPE